MSNLFVILYELPVYNRPEHWPIRLWHRAVNEASAIPFQADPHFLAKFTPYNFYLDRSLWQKPTEDFSSTLNFETNTFFLARYAEPRLYRPVFPQPTDGAAPAVVDNPRNFIATFKPSTWRAQYLWLPTEDTNSSLHFETNTNFISTFMPVQFKLDTSLWRVPATDFIQQAAPTDVQHLWGFCVVRKPL